VSKLCVSAASLLGVARSEQPLEHLKDVFEALESGGEAAAKLRASEAHIFVDALRAAEKDVQAAYEESLRKQHSDDFRETVQVAFANFAEVFDRCLPRGEEFARLGHDPLRIGQWVADAAAKRQMEVFKDGEGRKMLVALVALAYERLDKNPEFMEALQRANWQELFGQLAVIRSELAALREIVDRLTRHVGLREAEKAGLVADLARVQAELGSTLSLLAGFLEDMVGRQVPPDQFRATLFKIAADWRLAGERIDALQASRNLSPEIAVLRGRAREAFAEERVADVESLLARIERIEHDAIARLEAHEGEVRAELALRREGFIETKRARLALARAQLRHEEVAALIVEIIDLTESENAKRFERLRAEQNKIYIEGRDRGLNGELELAIALARLWIARARDADERGAAQNNLGSALRVLGERESGTARLEEAGEAFRAALEERRRDRVPLDWAQTQNDLGLALLRRGERESGTARLEEAGEAFRAALEERTRDRVPLQWAQTLSNLGSALLVFGQKQRSPADTINVCEKAVEAYQAALEELTRDRVPLQWANTQCNLGSALMALGERWREIGKGLGRPDIIESETARLEEAVEAFRAALEELTRDRVPLQWANTQIRLGKTLELIWQRSRAYPIERHKPRLRRSPSPD